MIKNWSVVYKSLEQVVIGESSSKLIIYKRNLQHTTSNYSWKEMKSTISLHFLSENKIIFNVLFHNIFTISSKSKLKYFSNTKIDPNIWTWIWLTYIIRSIIECISGRGPWRTKWLPHSLYSTNCLAIDRLS